MTLTPCLPQMRWRLIAGYGFMLGVKWRLGFGTTRKPCCALVATMCHVPCGRIRFQVEWVSVVILSRLGNRRNGISNTLPQVMTHKTFRIAYERPYLWSSQRGPGTKRRESRCKLNGPFRPEVCLSVLGRLRQLQGHLGDGYKVKRDSIMFRES